jgi:hypothetical protein
MLISEEKISIKGANLNREHLSLSSNLNLGCCTTLNIQRPELQHCKDLHGQIIIITIVPDDITYSEIYFPTDFHTIFISKLPEYRVVCGCNIYIGVNIVGKELSNSITIKSFDLKMNKDNILKFNLELYSDKLDGSYQLKYKGSRINFDSVTSDININHKLASIKLRTNIILRNDDFSVESTKIKFHSFSPEGSPR